MAYLVFWQKKEPGKGIAKAFSNRKLVAEFIKVSYSTLTNHFVRQGEDWHFYEEPGVYVIQFDEVVKGRQRVHKSGMESRKRNWGHDRNI